ncbi:MAG TPA: hypothetical protein ENJ82_02220 [Bacteroidetes bacterium]|nr:hypothetical protein [Bacteroidota bacterium]
MTIAYNLSYFNGKKVYDYNIGDGISDPLAITYRFRVEYDEETSQIEKIADFAKQAGADQVPALVIGNWDSEGGSSYETINMLIELKDKFPALRHIFFGDISYEESEMSWIQNGNITPLLNAYPELESLTVRGAAGLSFTDLKHEKLKKLRIQTGGLGMGTIREVIGSHLPALEHLEFWLGSDNYGWDGTVEDVKILFDLPQFPNLHNLGICNSIIADEIAVALGDAPILKQIKELGMFNGAMSDVGAKALATNPHLEPLDKLDLHYHYISSAGQKELKAALKALKVKVDLKKGQGETDPEDRYIRVSE